MQVVNSWAIKEWAVVEAALASGRQSLLIRKGGIQEAGIEFELEHREFWLFPTRFHQTAEQLRPEAADLLHHLHTPPNGQILFSHYAVVQSAYRLNEPDRLAAIAPLQILSDEVLTQRFHYRHPGLTVLQVRLYRRPAPLGLPNLTRYDGCHSWVDLEQELSTAGLTPVLSTDEFRQHQDRLREALGGA